MVELQRLYNVVKSFTCAIHVSPPRVLTHPPHIYPSPAASYSTDMPWFHHDSDEKSSYDTVCPLLPTHAHPPEN